MHSVLAILDTGAGPNMVRESFLPKDWRRFLVKTDSPYPLIRDANGRQLKVEGVVSMYLDIGGRSFRLRFLVCKNLAVKAILGCAFIRRCVQLIFSPRGQDHPPRWRIGCHFFKSKINLRNRIFGRNEERRSSPAEDPPWKAAGYSTDRFSDSPTVFRGDRPR